MAHRPPADAGFTLLELLVVLAVAALALTAAVPAMQSSHDQATLRATAASLGAALRSARSEAIRSNRPQTLTVDPATRSWSTSLDGRPHLLPPGLGLHVRGAARSNHGSGVIRFERDGSAAATVIEVSDGRRSALIEVQWPTGAARLRWGA